MTLASLFHTVVNMPLATMGKWAGIVFLAIIILWIFGSYLD